MALDIRIRKREMLQSRSTVTLNTIYNLAGSVVSIVVSVITVPIFLRTIGDARYGVLALVWLLLGYFGLFDLGLSRAASNRIAKLQDAPGLVRERVFWTAVYLNSALGLVGALVLYAGFWSGTRVGLWSGGLGPELAGILPILLMTVPLGTVMGVFIGVVEGCEHFLLSNIIQSTSTVLVQLLSLSTALIFGPDLRYIIVASVLTRVVMALTFAIAAIRVLPVRAIRPLDRTETAALLGYGGWITLTNLVGPILASVDQLVIGAIYGPVGVARYVVPFGLVSKALIVPNALAKAVFPKMSRSEPAHAGQLADSSTRVLGVILTLMCVPGILLAKPFLDLWVGADFAARAAPIAHVLVVGIWINGLSVIPFSLLQAQGRPDLVAKYHLLELLPFLLTLWVGVELIGPLGAAFAWTARAMLDGFLLFRGAAMNGQQLRCLLPGIAFIAVAEFFPLLADLAALPSLLAASLFELACLGWAIWTAPDLFRFMRLRPRQILKGT